MRESEIGHNGYSAMTDVYHPGANSSGQLGQRSKCEECVKPSTVPLDHLALELDDVTDIVGGANHSFLLAKDGSVFGCGSNARGQLADVSEEECVFKIIPSLSKYGIKQLSTKWDTSYAVTNQDVCLTWGPNSFGQQGSTSNENVASPIQLLSNVKQVAVGLRHVLLLSKDGTVHSAGDGKRGQLGHRSSGLCKVEGLQGVIQVACGQNHNLVLTDEGKVLGWGCNKFRQLAKEESDVINNPTVVYQVESTNCKLLCGWTHSGILDDKGKLINWGRNKYSQLGVKSTPFQCKPQELTFQPFKDVAFGSEHCLAITVDNHLVSWGWNEHGNCGTGNTADVVVPTVVLVERVLKIGAGTGQSFAVVACT